MAVPVGIAEIWQNTDPVSDWMDPIMASAETGRVGDDKIFVTAIDYPGLPCSLSRLGTTIRPA